MRPPGVLPILEGFGGTCGIEQSIAQPRCITALKIERLSEYPGLMPASRMRGVQTIVLDLAHIEDCLIAVWQTLRHRGRLASHPVERKPIDRSALKRAANIGMSRRRVRARGYRKSATAGPQNPQPIDLAQSCMNCSVSLPASASHAVKSAMTDELSFSA